MKRQDSVCLIILLIFFLLACKKTSNNSNSSLIFPTDYLNQLKKGIDVDWSKTSSGSSNYNLQTVKDFKTKGFSHVRIRIKDTIDNILLSNLDNQVNDCLNNGIIPIIAYQANDFKVLPNDVNLNKVVAWWQAIAVHYKGYSPLLSFDIIIEVTDSLNKRQDKLNEVYEKTVTSIRMSNPNRLIFISPRLRSDPNYLTELTIPTQANGYLLAEWHFYAAGPSKTNPNKLWTTGTAAEKKIITDYIALAKAWEIQTGIKTWVGAWMPGNYNDGNDYTPGEQIVFGSFMSCQLTKNNIPFAINADNQFYDATSNSWITNLEPVVNAIINPTCQ